MKSESLAKTVFSQIEDNQVTYTDASEYDPLYSTASHHGGTCHISVVDEDGNAVSATTTVNYQLVLPQHIQIDLADNQMVLPYFLSH